MRTLLFDTETTGLPTKRNVPATQSPLIWPDLVSISWILCDGPRVLKRETHYIKPEGWVIPEDSIKIHGITNEYATKNGNELKAVIEKFKADLLTSHHVIAHNMEFDRNVIIHALKWRLNQDPTATWDPKKELCSMQSSKNELKLPSRYPKPGDLYKNPRLDELYTDTFKKPPPPQAHSSDRDVEVLYEIVNNRWPAWLL
jgi:DNA polymerase III epsilon subunit-like protein